MMREVYHRQDHVARHLELVDAQGLWWVRIYVDAQGPAITWPSQDSDRTRDLSRALIMAQALMIAHHLAEREWLLWQADNSKPQRSS